MTIDSDRVRDAATPSFRRQADRDAALLGAGFADALLAGDGGRAEAIALRARSAGLSLAAVHGRIITPAMYVVGDLWERDEIGVADEHLATVVCHRVLAALHATIRGLPRRKGASVLLATPAGQRHALGLRMVADVLESTGYAVTHLGADIPDGALHDAVRRHRPDVVGLSLAMLEGLDSLERAIGAVTAADPATALLIGGQALPDRLLCDGVCQVTDIEAVATAVEELSGGRRDRSDERGGLARARARRAEPPPPPTVTTCAAASTEEQLVRAAEGIGDVAREQARLADRYRALAFEDELCELPNRRAFDDRFRELAEVHGLPDAPPLMVMLLDLDDLKLINDAFGHDAGDLALRLIARALRDHLREQDLPARLGGDEFGALLPGVEPHAAVEIAERVCAAIRAGFGDDPSPITASCGIARYDGDRRRTLIRADESLFDAKRAGRDRVLLAK